MTTPTKQIPWYSLSAILLVVCFVVASIIDEVSKW